MTPRGTPRGSTRRRSRRRRHTRADAETICHDPWAAPGYATGDLRAVLALQCGLRAAETRIMGRRPSSLIRRSVGVTVVLATAVASHIGAAWAGQVTVGTIAQRSAILAPSRSPASVTATDAERRIHAIAHLVRESSSSDVPGRSLLVALVPGLTVREHPGTGRVIGAMPARSKYYGVPLVAWVLRTSQGGRYGEVAVPFSPTHAVGWIPLRGLRRTFNRIEVKISVSRHRLSVYRSGRSVRTFVVGTGASWSPTPPGDYFVTDRVPFPAGSALGWFAFGISGVQPHLPPGWRGGDQMAIHGTNDPSTIGKSRSAGCIHVSSEALRFLVPLLQLGTPVVIQR